MVETFTVIFSGFAVLISIFSILSSKKSNSLSKRALTTSEESNDISKSSFEYSKKTFEFQNRPWLVIDVKKNKESHRYYDIIKNGNEIIWKVSFLIENIGASPATNITIPDLINMRDNTMINETQYVNIDSIILGHGKKYQYDFEFGDIVNCCG